MNHDHISSIFEAKKKIVELERQKAELDKPRPISKPAAAFVLLLALLTLAPAVGLFYLWPAIPFIEQKVFLVLLATYCTYTTGCATKDCYKLTTNRF